MLKTRLKDRHKLLEMILSKGFYNLTAFAKKADLNYSTLQHVTSGDRNPSARTAFKIAAALDMNFYDLFEFEHTRGEAVHGGTKEEKADLE